MSIGPPTATYLARQLDSQDHGHARINFASYVLVAELQWFGPVVQRFGPVVRTSVLRGSTGSNGRGLGVMTEKQLLV